MITLASHNQVEDMRGKKKKKKKGGNITSTAHPMRMPSAEVAKEDGDIKAPSDISLPVSMSRSHLPPAVRECSLHIIKSHRSRAPLTGPL